VSSADGSAAYRMNLQISGAQSARVVALGGESSGGTIHDRLRDYAARLAQSLDDVIR